MIKVSGLSWPQLWDACVEVLPCQLFCSRMSNCACLRNDEGHRTVLHSDSENLHKIIIKA